MLLIDMFCYDTCMIYVYALSIISTVYMPVQMLDTEQSHIRNRSSDIHMSAQFQKRSLKHCILTWMPVRLK